MPEIAPALLLFTTACGYLFLHRCHFLRERAAAWEWDRIVLLAASFGLAGFIVVRLFLPAMERLPLAVTWRNALHATIPLPFLGTMILVVISAVVFAWILNRFFTREQSIRWAVYDYGGELFKLLLDSSEQRFPVSLTMDNRKVYIGYVSAAPTLRTKSAYVTLIPSVSGYRDVSTMTLSLDTPYWQIYEDLDRKRAAGTLTALDRESFGIVLPLEAIRSANRFDSATYEKYFRSAHKEATGRSYVAE